MLIDAAKGLEPQTRKLFEVCQLRSLPIFTFVNKLDRPGREALELIDEIEQELGLQTYVVNWPIGMGDRFKGVYDRRKKEVHLFERNVHGKKVAQETVLALGDPKIEVDAGVLVIGVQPNSPAAQANLKPGDVIQRMDQVIVDAVGLEL